MCLFSGDGLLFMMHGIACSLAFGLGVVLQFANGK